MQVVKPVYSLTSAIANQKENQNMNNKKNDVQIVLSELNENQCESINGGIKTSNFGININVNPVLQGNFAIVLAKKVHISQGNIYGTA